ncbi:ribonuclease H1 isoform X2 [Thrips palmi]|nr:ribonuclease H1 isoform X2 [Thrips palmi]XP_034246494.1 ribonuclease H1 isoform X2 [Thrips palmi]XP_034246501.1 ribonuclease H1 isoform X2 [Thrips palmi]
MEIEVKPEDASSNTFDFAAFNLRLTNLENTYQEKIRSLEERLRALENNRAHTGGEKKEENVKKTESDSSSSKAGDSGMSATKRKLLDSATKLIKPNSRNYSTSSLKRLRSEEDPALNSDSSSFDGDTSSNQAPPFKVDSDGFVIVYTDGACPKNGFNATKAGIGVWFNDQHPLNVSKGVTGRFTNNSAEIEAATVAVQTAAHAGISKLCIMTDSQFLISCMTQWLDGWKRKNWKTVKNEPVIVKDEILALEQACRDLDEVKWVHVRGHEGVYGNERADELARNGAAM